MWLASRRTAILAGALSRICDQSRVAASLRPLAQSDRRGTGRTGPLCPGRSDIDLFRCRERVIDLDAEIADRALDLRVTEQELHGAKIPGAPVDQGRLCPPQRMRSEQP